MNNYENNDHGFQFLKFINEGTFGRVFKGTLNKTKELVAIKEIKIELDSEGIPSTALREICILRELNHPNIVQLKEVICSEMKLFLVLDYLDVDLKKYIEDVVPKDKFIDPFDVKLFLNQILEGISYCHNKKILHRDLKPQNVLVNNKGVVKIADFGLARVFSVPIRPYTKEVLTLWYRAPEILMGIDEYSEFVDLWSVGCIFAEIATKKPLFTGENEVDQLKKIFSILGTPNPIIYPNIVKLPGYAKDKLEKFEPKDLRQMIPQLDNDGIDLLYRFLTYDPDRRITAKDALNHPYFNSLRKK